MYQPPGEQEPRVHTYWESFMSCLGLVLRLCCCINQEEDISLGDRGSRANLLESRERRSSNQDFGIETTLSPPRPPELEQRAPAKGVPPSGAQHPQQQRPHAHRHQHPPAGQASRLPKSASDASLAGSDSGNGSPTRKGGLKGKDHSRLSLLDDDDMCPTCLEAYTEDNPKVITQCGHHYHLPCIYEWLERSQTCPMCGRDMRFEELL